MKTDPNVTIAMIAAVASFATALLGAIVGLVNNATGRRNEAHAVEAKANIQETQAAVAVVSRQTNGMSERLAAVTGEKEFARGQHEGEALVQDAKQAGFDKGLKQGHKDAKDQG